MSSKKAIKEITDFRTLYNNEKGIPDVIQQLTNYNFSPKDELPYMLLSENDRRNIKDISIARSQNEGLDLQVKFFIAILALMYVVIQLTETIES